MIAKFASPTPFAPARRAKKSPEYELPLSAEDIINRDLLEKRILFLNSDISDAELEAIGRKLEYLAASSKEPITIIMTSPGGSVLSGFGFYDQIENITRSGIEVVIEVRGYAASMAAVILQAGSKRRATKRSRFLLHEIRQFFGFEIETQSQSEERVEETRRCGEVIAEIFAQRMGKTAKEVHEMYRKKEWWMSAQEALAVGLLDEII